MYITFMHNEENKVCFEADLYLVPNLLGLAQLSLDKDEPHKTNDQTESLDILPVIAGPVRR